MVTYLASSGCTTRGTRTHTKPSQHSCTQLNYPELVPAVRTYLPLVPYLFYLSIWMHIRIQA